MESKRAGAGLSAAVAALAVAGVAQPSTAAPVFDQSAVDTTNSYDVSTRVYADDFELTAPATLSTVQAYLVDNEPNNNGLLDSFGGTLSWAVYDDGGLTPGTIIASGSDSSLNYLDTGLQDSFNADIVRVEADLTPNVTLGPGIYWLALHEGTWQSPADGTATWWSESTQSYGVTEVFDQNETAPGTSWTTTTSGHTAFALVAVPEPGCGALLAGAVGWLLVRRSRRQRPNA